MTNFLKECTTHHLLVLEMRFASCATWCDWSLSGIVQIECWH